MTFIKSPGIWVTEIDRDYFWPDNITYGEMRRIQHIHILEDDLLNCKNYPEQYAKEIPELEKQIEEIKKELDDYRISINKNT